MPRDLDLEEQVCIWHRSLEKVWGGLSPPLWYLPDNLQLYLLLLSAFHSVLHPSRCGGRGRQQPQSCPCLLWLSRCWSCHPPATATQPVCDSAQGQGTAIPSPLVTLRSCKELYLLQCLICGETTPGPKVGNEEPPAKPLKALTCVPVLHCALWLLLVALTLHKHVVGFRKASARFLHFLPQWNCRRLWVLNALTAL